MEIILGHYSKGAKTAGQVPRTLVRSFVGQMQHERGRKTRELDLLANGRGTILLIKMERWDWPRNNRGLMQLPRGTAIN